VGGTVAWLTDKSDTVTNTFTPSNIDITLTETEREYDMVPGVELPKDPTVKVIAANTDVDCWLFVQVVESEGFQTYMDYEIDPGWTIVPGEDNVYYREVAKSDTDQTFPVLKDNVVTVDQELTNAQMDALTANPTLTITAYAVQKEGFATPEAAWAQAKTATPYGT